MDIISPKIVLLLVIFEIFKIKIILLIQKMHLTKLYFTKLVKMEI